MRLSLIFTALLRTLWCARPGHAIHNPIIPGWNPDPAVLRVGSEYFIATSSMEYWPGIPIYRSTDLQHWELDSHALTRPEQLQLNGVPTSAGTNVPCSLLSFFADIQAGAWAPSLSFINGIFYLTTSVRWTYDPVAKVWPRVFWVSSADLKHWSDPVWSDPWGIDPSLFQDPNTDRVYLNLMAPNNNIDKLWGIYQCEVDLATGRCVGDYYSLWNGTMPHTADARPEGPKMLKHGDWYSLMIAEGGTDELHRATIARSTSPTGPWEPAPNNPLLYNGKFGFNNLTVQSTGHATLFDTDRGSWYAVFLARRNINGSSPLGRETFLCPVDWRNGWPVFNNGDPILLDTDPKQPSTPAPFVDTFSNRTLHPSWYQLRTPYQETYTLRRNKLPDSPGLVLHPNVFSLSDRDVPAALLRKQISLNTTFSATLLPFTDTGSLGVTQSVGISAYLSELQHQDIGVTGCTDHAEMMCIYTALLNSGTTEYTQYPLKEVESRQALTLHIRAQPLRYDLGYSTGDSAVEWLASFPSSWMAVAPPDWFVFTGAMFGLFASGNGVPWSNTAPEVGFQRVREVYHPEDIPDFDRW